MSMILYETKALVQAILGAAALLGMINDLSLSVTDYTTDPPTTNTARLSWATSLFYFGMLVGLYPMTYALQYFRPGRLLGCTVLVWALLCMSTAAISSYKGLYIQRFLLGLVESIIPTGFMGIVSGFYTQSEQSLRQSLWFSSSASWVIIGAALNYGFAQIQNGRLHSWQYIYLLAGALTAVFGIFCFFLPDSPVMAWFLTPDERFAAVERLRMDQSGVRCPHFKWYQMREAMLDVKVWLLALAMASA